MAVPGSSRAPRIYLHPDGDFISVGFTDTNDTLLRMPSGWGDRDRVREWIVAVDGLIRRAYPERDI